MSSKIFLEGPIGKALFKLSVPIILANLLQTGYMLTDAFWVGKLGAASVAAVSVSFPVTFLVIALGSGLAIAGATLAAQYMGAGRQDQVNHVAAQTMTMVAFTSVIFGSIGFFLSPHLLVFLGVAPDVYEGALGFLHVSFVGIIFVFMYAMFQALMRGIGRTKIPLLIVLGTVILNFILDPLFIYGFGPIPAQGVMGAALATLGTQALASFIGIYIFLRGRHGIQVTWKDFKPDYPYIKRTFLLGMPGSIELSMRALGPMVMTFLATGFGTYTIAAYGVGANILQVMFIPAMGISMAVSTLVGQNIGAGKVERAGRVTFLGSIAGFTVLSLAGIVSFFCAEPLVHFFIPSDPHVITIAAQFIRIMCLSWGLFGVQFCIVSAFRAAGQMVNAMVIAMVSQFVFQLPLAYILSKFTSLGAVGLWWAFPISISLTTIIAAVWFSRGTWKKSRLTDEKNLVRKVTDAELKEEGMR